MFNFIVPSTPQISTPCKPFLRLDGVLDLVKGDFQRGVAGVCLGLGVKGDGVVPAVVTGQRVRIGQWLKLHRHLPKLWVLAEQLRVVEHIFEGGAGPGFGQVQLRAAVIDLKPPAPIFALQPARLVPYLLLGLPLQLFGLVHPIHRGFRCHLASKQLPHHVPPRGVGVGPTQAGRPFLTHFLQVVVGVAAPHPGGPVFPIVPVDGIAPQEVVQGVQQPLGHIAVDPDQPLKLADVLHGVLHKVGDQLFVELVLGHLPIALPQHGADPLQVPGLLHHLKRGGLQFPVSRRVGGFHGVGDLVGEHHPHWVLGLGGDMQGVGSAVVEAVQIPHILLHHHADIRQLCRSIDIPAHPGIPPAGEGIPHQARPSVGLPQLEGGTLSLIHWSRRKLVYPF